MKISISLLGWIALIAMILPVYRTYSAPRQLSVGTHEHEERLMSQSEKHPELINTWCSSVREAVRLLKWKVDPCTGIQWKIGGFSVQGRPLVYAEFGRASAENATLIFSTVHGDEITPLYLGLQLIRWLHENEATLNHSRVVVAPLVNPDGFFKKPKTRMNARGVDVNRNFATQDWNLLALQSWKKRFRSDPRRFPGNEPSSEPETRFQENLIEKVQPAKVLSIHSPLNFLDYDGPTPLALSQFPHDYKKSLELLKRKLKATSGGYFPGSLGNFAGRELGIPTVTLELPSADPRKADAYWKKFSQGISLLIDHSVPKFSWNPSPGSLKKAEKKVVLENDS